MRGIAAYKKSHVETASPAHLVVLVYQEAVKRLNLAQTKILASDLTWREDIHHVRAIYLELINALDHEVAPDLCASLNQLYVWCMDELIAIGASADIGKLQAVLRVTQTLLEGWQGAAVETSKAA